jgi:hypothetical protein
MDDKMVKGTMLINFARMIRSNKNLNWNRYLKPEDWEIVNTLVLPSKWYPFETYLRCAMASFQLLGNGKLETARLSGQLMGKNLFETTYRSIITTKDPLQGLKKFVLTYVSFFNFSSLKFDKIEEKHVQIHNNYDTGKEAIVPYCHQLMGVFDSLIEITGGQNHKIWLSAKQWEGAPTTTFDITWQ